MPHTLLDNIIFLLRYRRSTEAATKLFAKWKHNADIAGFNATAVSPLAAQAMANYALNPMPGLAPSNFSVRGGLGFITGQNGRHLWNGQAL